MTPLRARALANLCLLLLVAAVAGVIWLEPFAPSRPQTQKLSDIDPFDVRRVRVERPGRAPVELVRGAGGWRLERPMKRPANEIRAAALAGIAAAPVHAGFRAEGNALDEFGLDPPEARVMLDGEVFEFGDTEPLNGWRYVRRGPQVHLITDAYFHHLLADPAAFVHPAPLPPQAMPTGFELPAATLERDGGRWRVTTAPGPADADAAGRLAAAWRSARAASVKAYDDSMPWNGAVEIRLEAPAPVLRFRIARTRHQVVLGRPDWSLQYHFPERAGTRLIQLGG